jgi:hypothetical protein
MWKTTNYKGEEVTWYSEEDIKPFLDPYFNGLDFKTIAELAKKSIRITAENCRLKYKLEDIADLYDDSEYAKQVKKIIQREN